MSGVESVVSLRRARAHGTEALAEVLHSHYALVWRLARRVAGADSEVEDVVQDALVAVATSLGRFRGQCKLSTWIAGITVRTAVRHAERRRRYEALVAPLENDAGTTPGRLSSDDPSKVAEAKDLRAYLLACVSRLAPEQRASVCLRYLEGMALQEVAQALGVPPGTIKSRLHGARQALRGMMAPYVAESEGETP